MKKRMPSQGPKQRNTAESGGKGMATSTSGIKGTCMSSVKFKGGKKGVDANGDMVNTNHGNPFGGTIKTQSLTGGMGKKSTME